MDNCQIYKSKELRLKTHILYNFFYHSKSNSIKNVFSCLKNQINRAVNNSYKNIIKILKDFRTSFNSEKTYKYF
jgi:hypothetical protein